MNINNLSATSLARRHPEKSLNVGVAGAVVVLSKLSDLFHTTGVVLRADVFALLITVVAFAGTARWAVFSGLLLTGGFANDWVGGAVNGFAGLLTILVVARLWLYPDPRTEPSKWALQYGATTVAAIVVYAAFVGALGDIAGRFYFYAGFLSTVELNLVLAVVSLPVAWVINRAIVHREIQVESDPLLTPRRQLAAAVILLWATGAYVGSYLFSAVGLIPTALLSNRTHPAVESLIELSGPHGVRTVFLFNAVAVSLLLMLLYRDTVRDFKERWSVV